MMNLSTICSPYMDTIPRYNRTPKKIGMGITCSPGASRMDKPATTEKNCQKKFYILSELSHAVSVT